MASIKENSNGRYWMRIFLSSRRRAFLLSLVAVAAIFYAASNRDDRYSRPEPNSSPAEGVRMVKRRLGLRPLQRREELGALLEEMKFETGAEVGVLGGSNAHTILSQWKSCKEFHLIDLWAHQENYIDNVNQNDQTHLRRLEKTKRKLKQWESITTYHKMLSVDAAKEISDYSLDFVYIDARHDYCGVMEDLEAYWPKLRMGGILAGHDYLYASEVDNGQDWSLCYNGTTHPGAVRGAVEDFAKKYGLVISVMYREGIIWASWMTQKPWTDWEGLRK